MGCLRRKTKKLCVEGNDGRIPDFAPPFFFFAPHQPVVLLSSLPPSSSSGVLEVSKPMKRSEFPVQFLCLLLLLCYGQPTGEFFFLGLILLELSRLIDLLILIRFGASNFFNLASFIRACISFLVKLVVRVMLARYVPGQWTVFIASCDLPHLPSG